MTELDIRELLDDYEDDSVTIQTKPVVSVAHIKEVTMERIYKEEKTAHGGKFGRGAVIALVAAACLTISAAALGAGRWQRNVNWRGEAVGETYSGELSADAEFIDLMDEDTSRRVADTLSEAKPRELVIVRWEGGSQSSGRQQTVSTPEQAEALIEEGRSALSVPFSVPEGYALTEGFVRYDSASGYTLVSSEKLEGGLTVDRYFCPEAEDFVSAYLLVCENAGGKRLVFQGQLMGEFTAQFASEEGARVETIEVSGMKDALLIESADHTAIYLHQMLEESVDYVNTLTLMDFDAAEPYTEALYSVTGIGLDADAVCSLLK